MSTPVLIAHRGASGTRPEHTAAAYQVGLELGADAIEVDLVATLDGHLVARHEPELSRTTDIARRPEFGHLRTTKTVDSRPTQGWFADDLTLAELRTLRAMERMPDLRPANAAYDGVFPLVTFSDVLHLAEAQTLVLGRPVRVYAEMKHETWHAGRGLRLPELVADLLASSHTRVPVTVMSFEVGSLKWLRANTCLSLMQLIDSGGLPYDRATAGDATSYRDMVAPRGLVRIAEYADSIGVAKNLVIPRRIDGRLGEATDLVGDAHTLGLSVAAWTLRSENDFLPAELRSNNRPAEHGNAVAEYNAFMAAGVDMLIGDHVESGARALQTWFAGSPGTSPVPVAV